MATMSTTHLRLWHATINYIALALTIAGGMAPDGSVDPVWNFPVHLFTGYSWWAWGRRLGPALAHHRRAARYSVEGVLQISNYSYQEDKNFQNTVSFYYATKKRECIKIIYSTLSVVHASIDHVHQLQYCKMTHSQAESLEVTSLSILWFITQSFIQYTILRKSAGFGDNVTECLVTLG